ncbi:MAG: hypothetical protein KDC04_02010 [Saprospiraceae bacterium]|nr:hypothetical protein [Saprospiraceae bacterium]MCB9309769.1 hypothetical protein [Lewinellaceae bacterium]
MKTVHYIAFALNGLVALYFIYMAALQAFVYFANQNLGQNESFGMVARYGIIAIIFIVILAASWILLKQNGASVLGKVILYFPIGLALGYALWAILIVISSGGRWN